jgi:hypothetical protein
MNTVLDVVTWAAVIVGALAIALFLLARRG